MARPTKQRPPVKQEAEEMEAQEMGETSEEETREGTEDGAFMKNNRKRSPKGAKNTKAPMDAECGTCKSGKPCSCKAKKDGGCGGYGKRGDALTPHEYLAACDLGIQDRSRPYIRARLDATERLDLKCGNGSISEGEKCSKGTAQKAQQAKKGGGVRGALENAAILSGTAGTLFSSGQAIGKTMSGDFKGAGRALQRQGAFAALSATGMASKGARTNSKFIKQQAKRSFGSGAVSAVVGSALTGDLNKANLSGAKSAASQVGAKLRNLAGGASAAKSNVTFRTKKSQFERMYKSPGRRDSAFAAGFTPDYDQLAI